MTIPPGKLRDLRDAAEKAPPYVVTPEGTVARATLSFYATAREWLPKLAEEVERFQALRGKEHEDCALMTASLGDRNYRLRAMLAVETESNVRLKAMLIEETRARLIAECPKNRGGGCSADHDASARAEVERRLKEAECDG